MQSKCAQASHPLLPNLTSSSPTRRISMTRRSQPLEFSTEQVHLSKSCPLPDAEHTSSYHQQGSYTDESRSHPGKGQKDDDNSSFLGASSAVGFMKEVHGVFDMSVSDGGAMSQDTPCSTDTFLPAKSPWFDDRSTDDNLQQAMQEFLLPPRRTADELLHLYFNYVHPEMPVFQKPSFLRRYLSSITMIRPLFN